MDWGGLLAATLVIVASGVYVALFRPLGFPLSTGLFALVLLAIFARLRMKPLAALLQAAVLTGLVYLLFAVLFDVRLPQGPEGPTVDALRSRIEALVAGGADDPAPPASGTAPAEAAR